MTIKIEIKNPRGSTIASLAFGSEWVGERGIWSTSFPQYHPSDADPLATFADELRTVLGEQVVQIEGDLPDENVEGRIY